MNTDNYLTVVHEEGVVLSMEANEVAHQHLWSAFTGTISFDLLLNHARHTNEETKVQPAQGHMVPKE